jgi:hypothetical protein
LVVAVTWISEMTFPTQSPCFFFFFFNCTLPWLPFLSKLQIFRIHYKFG